MQKVLRILREAFSGEEKDYTSGSLNEAIILLAIPMILEMVMESLFAVVDIYWVSKLSVEAVAAVGLTESVVTIVYSIGMGLAMAATAMVSRRTGEKDPDAAARAAMQSIWLAGGIGLILGIGGLLFAPDILRGMGADEQVMATGLSYTRITFGFNIVIILLFLLNGVFRGAGDAVIAMRTLWLANGINILLDPMLIFGWGPFPEMGVAGAAAATVIGRGIGVLYQFYHLFWGKKGVIHIHRRHWRPDWHIIGKLANVGATGAGQMLIASISWIFLMRIISLSGSQAVAGYIIAIRIIVFTILPSWGLANAAATLVGQNLGARQPERAETSAWRAGFYNMAFLLVVGLVFFTFSRPIIGLFNTDPEVMKAGVLSLRIICVGYVFFAYGMVISQAFNGAGDTRTPTIINLICFWGMEIPLGYLMGVTLDLGLAGVCWAIFISETAMAIIAMVIFKKGKWKLMEI